MNSPYFFLKIIFLFLTVNACTVSSSQFESFFSPEQVVNTQEFYWDATYNNLNYRLIAIEMPNGTLFADKFGNSLFFDGWSIQSIVGFGDFDGDYEFQETDIGKLELNNENSFILGNSCGEWREDGSDNGLIYTQSCGTKEKFMNKIVVDSRGKVMMVQQFLEPFFKLMTLKNQN